MVKVMDCHLEYQALILAETSNMYESLVALGRASGTGLILLSLHCFDIVDWVIGRASSVRKLVYQKSQKFTFDVLPDLR